MYIIVLLIFTILTFGIMYLFSDEYLDKSEEKMIKEIVVERLSKVVD